jgi:hypothetical protein
VESPRFLFSAGKWEKGLVAINGIAKKNGITEEFTENDIKIGEGKVKQGYSVILRDLDTLRKILVITTTWFIANYGYYIMAFYVKYIHGSIY